MSNRQYIQSITFFTTATMYKAITDISYENRVTVSEMLRRIIKLYLNSAELKDSKE